MTASFFLEKIIQLLEKIQEPHLSYGIEKLSAKNLENFYSTLLHYSSLLPLDKKNQLLNENTNTLEITPLETYKETSIFNECKEGKALLAKGKVAAVLLAGGQASRLGSLMPKGMFPITPLLAKTLFQDFFAKVKACCQIYQQEFLVAVMVSPLNHKETKAYFEDNNWFDLNPSQIALFEQEMLPFLDSHGHFLLEQSGKLAVGPNGNGEVFKLLYQKGIFQWFEKNGVSSVEIIPIDNPLNFPFDPQLANAHQSFPADVILKACKRENEEEKVGVIGSFNRKVCIVEYSEIDATKEALHHFKLAHTGLLSVSMPFIKNVATAGKNWPLHRAFKKAKVLDDNGNLIEKEILKLETFLFDHLEEANHCAALVYPKAEIFAPLKQREGLNGITQVKLAISSLAKRIIQHIYGDKIGSDLAEIDPIIYLKNSRTYKITIDNEGLVRPLKENV